MPGSCSYLLSFDSSHGECYRGHPDQGLLMPVSLHPRWTAAILFRPRRHRLCWYRESFPRSEGLPLFPFPVSRKGRSRTNPHFFLEKPANPPLKASHVSLCCVMLDTREHRRHVRTISRQSFYPRTTAGRCRRAGVSERRRSRATRRPAGHPPGCSPMDQARCQRHQT